MSEETFNAADPRKVQERRRTEKRQQDQAREDLRELLALPAGRRFLWRLIKDEEWCGFFRTSYDPSGQRFAANEGRRGVGVQLVGEIMNVDPKAWVTLQQELLPPPEEPEK